MANLRWCTWPYRAGAVFVNEMISDGSSHLVQYNFCNKLKMVVSTAHAKAYDDLKVSHNSSTCISQPRIKPLIGLSFLIRDDRRQVLVNHKQNIKGNALSIDSCPA